jgi:DNA (cytosine-5)-methyltransferase 1
MSRPKLLDLFCCEGGASMGYHRAGFDVYGVDLFADFSRDAYPFPSVEGDAFTILNCLRYVPLLHGRSGMAFSSGEVLTLGDFDAVHASPPCQWSCSLTKGTNRGREYINLIPQTRAALDSSSLPYVIENVQGSDLRRDLTLCGEMFGLGVLRHRYFELGRWSMPAPAHKPHRGRVRGWRHGTYYDGPYVAVYGEGGGKGSVSEWQEAMGIDWTDNRKAIAEAIPPAYTEHIGRQLLAHIESEAAA